jgi:hypothetical protein
MAGTSALVAIDRASDDVSMAQSTAVGVPASMQRIAQTLFGATSAHANATKTSADWKRTLAAILDELWQYIYANVETDEVHMMMLHTGIATAKEALKKKDFWPEYSAGVLRIAFLLLGDVPDHGRYSRGRKRDSHYRLTRHRSIHYLRDGQQALNTLLTAFRFGHPELTTDAREAYRTFRQRFGYRSTHKSFLKWFRKEFPGDYAATFSCVQGPNRL